MSALGSGGGLTLPSMQDEHFSSNQLSISYWPWPMILLPEQSRPTIAARVPKIAMTARTAMTGPTDPCLE